MPSRLENKRMKKQTWYNPSLYQYITYGSNCNFRNIFTKRTEERFVSYRRTKWHKNSDAQYKSTSQKAKKLLADQPGRLLAATGSPGDMNHRDMNLEPGGLRF
jgi:hypothetical protein